jgi:hypothetical protein
LRDAQRIGRIQYRRVGIDSNGWFRGHRWLYAACNAGESDGETSTKL